MLKLAATPNSVFNIILEICFTDSSVDIPLLQKHNGMDHTKITFTIYLRCCIATVRVYLTLLFALRTLL
jgi:hypothetical protein